MEFIKFIIIGLFNTLIGFISFSIIYYFIGNEYISLSLAYIFGIVFNYQTYSKLVFYNSDKQIFINFIYIYLFIYSLNSIILYVLSIQMEINIYISQLIAICIVTPILYILNKKFVFIKE